eukprot:3360774-Rhodomonas_salina.1
MVVNLKSLNGVSLAQWARRAGCFGSSRVPLPVTRDSATVGCLGRDRTSTRARVCIGIPSTGIMIRVGNKGTEELPQQYYC